MENRKELKLKEQLKNQNLQRGWGDSLVSKVPSSRKPEHGTTWRLGYFSIWQSLFFSLHPLITSWSKATLSLKLILTHILIDDCFCLAPKENPHQRVVNGDTRFYYHCWEGATGCSLAFTGLGHSVTSQHKRPCFKLTKRSGSSWRMTSEFVFCPPHALACIHTLWCFHTIVFLTHMDVPMYLYTPTYLNLRVTMQDFTQCTPTHTTP